jgi:UDP-N-acetylmuramoyl-tripeptide--D-alanyl-D-alanine ligase
MVEGAIEAGLVNSEFAIDSDAAGELLANEIRSGDVVLVKGSRGVKTEKVIERLLKDFELKESKAAVQ